MSFLKESKFGGFTAAVENTVSAFLTLGIVSALIKLGTSNSGPAPDEKTAIAAHESELKAQIATEQMRKEEAILDEQRRRNLSPSM